MAKIDLRDNEFMSQFVGSDHVDSNDVQFWYQLLSCSFNFMRVQDPKIVDKTLSPYLDLLALNNSQSLNIGSLVRVGLDRISRIKSANGQSTNSYYIFQSFNALYLIRSICKNYVENSSEEKLVQSFRAKVETPTQPPQTPPLQMSTPPHLQPSKLPDQANVATTSHPNQPQPSGPSVVLQSSSVLPFEQNNGSIASPSLSIPNNNEGQQSAQTISNTGSDGEITNKTSAIVQEQNKTKSEVTSGAVMMDQFISALIAIIVDIPLTDSTYLLQVEAINALLVLLSVQMYSNTRANQSIIYRSLMQKRCSIHALVLTKTLLNNFIRQNPMPQETGSIIIGLASGLWKVLTLGYGQEEDTDENMPLLAKQSLLLLNVLTNHYTTEKNPYREAIISCQDSRFNLSDPQMAFDNANNDALATASTSKSIMMSNSIKIEFQELYDTICKHLYNDQVALLLYLLLHSNKIFKPYILTTAASRLDQLVLPLLKILYTSIQRGSHHVYMVLIVFVILSEETSFNEAIHKNILRGVPWFKDRVLNEISLGSFTALIMIRSFQFNTFRVKDKFLHTNLFATLGNLSNYFNNLHPYVCQRLVDLLERLTKRYLMITKPAGYKTGNFSSVHFNQTLEVLNPNNPLARALATDTNKQDFQDVSSMELDSTSANYGNRSANYQNGSDAINIIIPNQPVTNQTTSNNNGVLLPPMEVPGQEYNTPSQDSGQQSPNSNNSASEHINISMDDTKQDLSLIEEVTRMILEIINNSLATQLESNPDLIYTLLYKRNVFSTLLANHQSFYNMVINVERVLTFFYNKIEAYQRQLSVEEIKDVIRSSSREWNFDQNRDPSLQLLFRYVEDEQPEDFFIPYMWTRIYYSSGIVWNPKGIVLFNPEVV